jgi:hypothetical protein
MVQPAGMAASEHVVWVDVEGDLALFHAGTGAYFGLNHVGSSIWRLAVRGMPVDEIVASLTRDYLVEEGTAAREVHRFLADLSAAGLLVSMPGP